MNKLIFPVNYVALPIFHYLSDSKMLILHGMLQVVGEALAPAAHHVWAVRHSHAGADAGV